MVQSTGSNEIKRQLDEKGNDPEGPLPMKSLIILFSYHHHNTEKIARVFAKVLDAQVKTPQQVNPEELREYSLVGFGSGIYGAKNHGSLLGLADKLPHADGRKAFIFSTFGAPVAL
jgi:flavodoxin